MNGLNSSIVKNVFVPLPLYEEQRAIAAFLDRRCAQIDGIISDLERQIDLLKRYKKSLITEIVTRGLNKNAPMKDSGNDFSGQIPKDSEIVRFKYIAEIKPNLVDPQKYLSLPQISPENIASNSAELIDVKTVEDVGVESWNHRFYKGQLLYSKIRPELNKVTEAPFEGLCSADMYPIETKLPTRYLMYYMLSDVFLKQTVEISRIRVKMPKVNQDEVSNLLVVIHDNDMMDKIARYLDEKCEAVEQMICEKTRQKDSIMNYKQSLIYEYVTGKKRVKEARPCPSEQTS